MRAGTGVLDYHNRRNRNLLTDTALAPVLFSLNPVLERASALGSFFLNAALHDSDNKRETRGKFELFVNRSAAFDRV